jgi:DNA-binding CsgD family transcriptional regulator
VAAEVKRQDRRAEVLALTVRGLTTRAVGRQLGISHVQVLRDLKLALDERGTESKAHSRAIAKERIETIIAANMPVVEGKPTGEEPQELLETIYASKVDSGKLVLAAIALDARINGYEAPKEINLAGKDGKELPPPFVLHVTTEVASAFAEAPPSAPALPSHVNGTNGATH